MRIFIDSAELEEIKQVYEWGLADGITTNPSLIKAAVEKRKSLNLNLNIINYIREILSIAKNTPLSLEVTGTAAEEMVKQGRHIYRTLNSSNVCIKIPVNPAVNDNDANHIDGLAATRILSKEGISVNCTLIFTPEQALLAAKTGAKYVSPFAGRIDDLIRSKNNIQYNKEDYFPSEGLLKDNRILDDNGIVSGIDLVQKCVLLLKSYNLNTQVIAASLRNTRQVREAALAGSHIATVPFSVIKNMLKHTKTFEGMKKFIEDTVKEYAELTGNGK